VAEHPHLWTSGQRVSPFPRQTTRVQNVETSRRLASGSRCVAGSFLARVRECCARSASGQNRRSGRRNPSGLPPTANMLAVSADFGSGPEAVIPAGLLPASSHVGSRMIQLLCLWIAVSGQIQLLPDWGAAGCGFRSSMRLAWATSANARFRSPIRWKTIARSI
jgi:hypothetical protein